MSTVLLIDYGIGNVRSVANALEALGQTAKISNRPEDLRDAERIVLPGVGAFGEAMKRLGALGFLEALEEEVQGRGKPYLGLCVGMQILADRGFEHGEHAGLGWIGGEVRRIEPAGGLPVPHIGWNAVSPAPSSVLFRDSPKEPTFYFVHSYALRAADRATIAGTCDYGGEIVAAVERGHVFGTQFHPEKSQKAGLALLRNFLGFRC